MGLNTTNFGEAIINMPAGLQPGATSMTVADKTKLCAHPFTFEIDDEIFITTGPATGLTYPVLGGQERTTPALHANGAAVNIVLTSEMFETSYPKVRTITAAGDVTVDRMDDKIQINKSIPAATNVNLPDDAIEGKVYTIKDKAGNSSTYPITVLGDGFTLVMSNDKMSVGFYLDETGDWEATQ